MAKAKRAWVWIVGESSASKEMKVEDILLLCKNRDFVIYHGGKFHEAEEFAFNTETSAIHTYCFTSGYICVPPSIDLVPRGTTIEFGRYVFPKGK